MSEDRGDGFVPASALGRRSFLAAGATTTLASLLPGCNEAPPESIVPFVVRPPEYTPGESSYYATAALRGGLAVGLLAESRDGRPIKIEGHPEHPSSLGATGPMEQALVLSLYDRDRLSATRHGGSPSSFEAFARAFGPTADRPFTRRAGEGLHLWLEPTSSPLLAHLLGRLQERYPEARVWFDPSQAPLGAWEGSERVYGRVLEPRYRLERALRIVALDDDFLTDQPASLRWARDWASRRSPGAEAEMSRMYVAEASPTCTGAAADHRLAVPSSEIGALAAALLARLRERVPDAVAGALDGLSLPGATEHRRRLRRWVEAVASDLAAHRGRSLVLVGPRQPAHVHVLAHLINAALGNVGRTVELAPSPILDAGAESYGPAPLLEALDAGEVDALVDLAPNPAYTTPGGMGWAERARRATDRVHLAAFRDETCRVATWMLPALHPLERWGDARGHDGTWTLVQPLIRPLFGGKSAEDVLSVLLGERNTPIRRLLQQRMAEAGHDLPRALSRGFVDGTATPATSTAPRWEALPEALRALREEPPSEGYELDLRPDARLADGRHAENAWLQEMPEPITKLAWDNAALISEHAARELSVRDGDVLELVGDAGSARLPALVVKGQAERTVTGWLGFGRRAGGRTARGVGVDLSALRTDCASWCLRGVRVRPTGEHRRLATTQDHFELADEVPVALRASLQHLREHPHFAQEHDEPPPTLHHVFPTAEHQWGMGIDLGLCTGCSACVIACQAENDVPVVGKTQVALGREMHWLRIDRYLHVRGGEVRHTTQPMLCQHCEQAPCEYVCPVNATVHSSDGLNEMIYNRCVGTRFCSNNCPYKVRRFNWVDFHQDRPEPETMVFNPDVTVRGRGVMEKCTYCVQRIRRAEIRAQRERRSLRDGDVVTACQQACPTGAIVFGDLADEGSRVSRRHADRRTYAALHELGTRPRTRYLARVDHTNPELEEA